MRRKPRLLIFYHYFYPDNVVSALHFSQLGEELQKRGWQVIAMPCNRSCRDETKKFKAAENWKGTEIQRIWRPPLRQASSIGRILNAIWMNYTWTIVAFRKKKVPNIDILLLGTDPILSVLAARIWKLVRRNTRIAHWCFDLYPEVAIAEGILDAKNPLVRLLKRLLKSAYRSCDLIADIGHCMRARLQAYGKPRRMATLPPWALTEPSRQLPVNIAERRKIFGDAKLAISYSGNFGRAHSHKLFLDLARRLREEDIMFSFSVRGNSVDELKRSVLSDDTNITFVPFAPIEHLMDRLSASDIHLVSLQPQWTGTVVPSKFFGSLAVGRSVIFAGSQDSALARWIKTYGVGWVLAAETLESVARQLIELSHHPDQLTNLQKHCHLVYQNNFSKEQTTNKWDNELRGLLLHLDTAGKHIGDNILEKPEVTSCHCTRPAIKETQQERNLHYTSQLYD